MIEADTTSTPAENIDAKRVLLVEDDDAVARMFDRSLRLASYRVVRAANGRDASRLIEQGAFDAIVTDISMPTMSGIELLKIVRQFDADLPVVLVTGQPELETAIDALEYRALRYLVKPVGPTALRKVVAEAICARDDARNKSDALPLLVEQRVHANDSARRRTEFAAALSSLHMVFQPIVHVSEGILGFEALMRSREPSLSRPDSLLGAAEELSAFDVLGRAVRRAVAERAHEFPAAELLFVNLHPSELLDDQLYDAADPLAAHASRVVFEITERASLDDISRVDERIHLLRSMGYRFAVDDLGSGYAGLNSVIALGPDYVKVDMELVRDVDSSPSKKKLIESLARACDDLGIPVVFEGVETASEGRALLDVGGRLFQGYYLLQPSSTMDEATCNDVNERMRALTNTESLCGPSRVTN